MRILIHHPVKMPVLHYGGTERVAFWLARGLKQLGHQVSLFAAPGSQGPEGIECLTDSIELSKRVQQKHWDILHGFTKPTPELYEMFDGKVVVTIHGNGQTGETFHRNTVFISQDHARRHGATVFVYNGIDPAELLFSAQNRPPPFLFLSKTSWRIKNLKGAMHWCRQFQQPLWIAGGERPLLARAEATLRSGWKWVGSVSQQKKAQFLISGRALLFPVLWNEPFGLVLMESLVSGTPVLAHAFGSVPELLSFAPECSIDPRQPDAMERLAALLQGELPLPAAKICRDWVMNSFTYQHMAAAYVKVYEKILQGQDLHSQEPRVVKEAEDLS